MAARLRKTHQEDVRQKIQATQIVNRLTKHALGEIEMTATQVQASRILLDKSVANLSNVEHSGNPDMPVKIEFAWKQGA
mgnify:CR=1 FL=1